MSSWRISLRVARREARRAKGRSAMVVAMIAVPVAALSFIAVGYDTFTLSATEQADRTMGATQASVTWPFDGPVEQAAGSEPHPGSETGERGAAGLGRRGNRRGRDAGLVSSGAAGGSCGPDGGATARIDLQYSLPVTTCDRGKRPSDAAGFRRPHRWRRVQKPA